MVHATQNEQSATLLALGLSVEASRRTRALQYGMANIAAMGIPPVVPLLWCRSFDMPFEQLHLPKMPPSILFDTPHEDRGTLFLTSLGTDWNDLASDILGKLRPLGEHAGELKVPFPACPGILIGARGQAGQNTIDPIPNSDWRLLCLQCCWVSDTETIVHLRHLVQMDRHLA